ncbi:hypothetical protein CK203_049471 [Vitis vinifera]|uniref:Integrase catalytic domain-containing protein n=1 Tax=Vitis vinifera TaxID=29760 RepID=A0A438HAT5_VITVI|nr:hypothetical protein CK203_049471 [Vitis vinifera]
MDSFVQEFDLQIRDKKGVENVVVDHLSSYCEVPSEWNAQDRKHLFAKIHAYYWEEPFLFKYGADQIIRKCVPEEEQQGILSHCHENAYYVSKWVEAIPYKHNDHRVVLKFLKENIFSRFGVPKAIISDGGQVELANREIKNILMKSMAKHAISLWKLNIKLGGQSRSQHGLDQSWAKRCLDLNEMEELRNDAYINSKVAKQRMKREAQVKVDRPFHYSPSASNGVVELLNSKSIDIFKVNGHRVKPFNEPFKLEKEDITSLSTESLIK